MSSHQNSAYNGETVFQLPGRSVPGSRYAPEMRRQHASLRTSGGISRPPDQIWGHYNNYRANGVAVSAIIHLAVLGLLLSGIFVSHQITQRASHQTVTLIAPSPDS